MYRIKDRSVYMETVCEIVKEPKIIFSQTKEQPVECDIVLPDYYPEISKILDCEVKLGREAVTVTADKISVSGKASVRLLYASAENELKAYDAVTKYTRLIPGDGFETSDICVVSQVLSSLNFRAVSPRKAEIRADASVKAEVYRAAEKSVVSDIKANDAEKLITASPCFSISAFSFTSLEINGRLSLPAPKDKISAMLRQSVKLELTEIKSINNKLMLSGFSDITFVYIDSDNKVSPEMNAKIPFTEIKEVYGVNENDICRVLIKNAEPEIDLKNSSAGDNEAVFSVTADAVILTGSETQINRIEDAYSVRTNLEIKKSKLFLPSGVKELSDAARFSGEIQCFDSGAREICDKSASDISFSWSVKNGEMNISGSMKIYVLAKNSDGEYCCYSRTCSFDNTLQGVSESDKYFFAASCERLSAEIASDGKIAFSGEISLKALCIEGDELETAAGVEETGRKPSKSDEKIVLYYGEKGERIWDIAKENNTSVSSLITLNDISSDSLESARLLVFRS